ncbi:uncharacterized protein N7443_005551 [Penicillium atrosanguineum]|uniref:uncharacterized protein n=1 Tax=Penicillium atrosanguineum TaxID=1132637 RepID=UPI002382FD45|nr:uncharacterized protein N7443_005551 [Penicillium atrosanguineum]KAJ5300549.1 hypothetical protein N7443_005551 [Penicillium atrosanguineum]
MGLSVHLSLCLLLLLAISDQAYGFGAGNIASLSRIEGQNWRHGDIEDTLLSLFLARVAGGRKFGKLDVKRVYFGNWLRDYSQAVDVGTVKYVSAEAIRILIWVLGYGTHEFEVTTERLGCYQPTEHIDNPKGYAEGEDARSYDRRLRGPVDEERELSIDPRTGLKAYIASEDMDIDTSAALIRRVLGQSIQRGRRYAQSGNNDDLYEALRLLGTGLHCLEDYAAHSNYTELALIEMGETDVFPHVGRNAMLELSGAQDYVYPIVTGTFGGVDFFHSVLGELSDKTKQSELQSLEGVIQESESDSPSGSLLQDLLHKIPSGLLGDSDQAGQMDDFKAKANDARQNNQEISPHEPEEWTRYLDNVQKQIYPILEWHDQLLKAINEAIEKIPVLPELIEQVQDQITVFVFSILAPYVLPIIKQVKAELETGSSEVIQSSREQQHIVFNDDSSSDPTHSMLSKDHFSNVLNEPAGRIASQCVKWAVPQLMELWDNEEIDINRTLNRIITGIFHHPAQREHGEDGATDIRHTMFSTVEQWWSEKSDEECESLREQLSRDGVLEGRNHKEGVEDCGHGCGKPIALPKGHNASGVNYQPDDSGLQKIASEALGDGALGGLVGGLISGVGSMVLNNGGSDEDGTSEHRHRPNQKHKEYHETEFYGGVAPPQQGGYQYQSETAYYSDQPAPRDDYPGGVFPRTEYAPNLSMQGSHREEYQQYRQEENGGYYRQERRETYESGQTEYQRTETRYEYGSPQPAFETVQQGSYGREGFEQGYQASYGGPPREAFGEFEQPRYRPPGEIFQEQSYAQRFEGGGGEEYGERPQHHPHHQRRSSNGSGSRSDDERERHRHRHHRHHHRSGSEDSD